MTQSIQDSSVGHKMPPLSNPLLQSTGNMLCTLKHRLPT